jgi:hypothetical protein
MNTPKRYRRRPFIPDNLIPRYPVEVEAMQLVGTAVDTMHVCEWVRDNGYPWLLGNALDPKSLIPEGGGKPGDQGIYLDPATGELVIHTVSGNIRASFGDWVFKVGEWLNAPFNTCSPVDFEATYEPTD